MGYACPVCSDPQADAEHLANHLAFTAMLGDDDHEAWLDEHAPEWADTDPEQLAAVVTEHANEREFPQVFEDTTGEHDHAGRDPEAERSGALFDDGSPAVGASGRAGQDRELDGETQEILEDAQELTREMLAEEDTDDSETE